MNKAIHYAKTMTYADVRAIRIRILQRRTEGVLLFLTGTALGSVITNLLIIWSW